MNQNIISAVFDSRSEAEAAVSELRNEGIDSDRLSLIGRDEDGTSVTDGSGERTDEGMGDAAKGALGGAGIGAILGVAALAIPGVGPLAAAGATPAPPFPARPRSARAPALWPAASPDCSRTMASATKTRAIMKAGSMTAASSSRSTPAKATFRPKQCARS